MASWNIWWNFDKPSYSPGDFAFVSLWLENVGSNSIYLSSLEIGFDFGIYPLKSINGIADPGKKQFLGGVSIELPEDVVGIKTFELKYNIHEFVNSNGIDLGSYVSNCYSISICPSPLYKVFVSRGLWIEDRMIGDPIAHMIREWGFNTVTIGIEVLVQNHEVSEKVKSEIKSSDALIAIATPRFLDSLTGLWKTLEWCHSETGIAFGLNKPLLILKDNRLSLGGLPSYLSDLPNQLVVEFNPAKLDELKMMFSEIMPGFRDWIAGKKKQEFFNTLGKIAVGGLALKGLMSMINGSEGSTHGSSG